MRRATIALVFALITGCAPGKSVLTVVLDGDATMPIGPIASLSATPSDSAGHKDTVNIPVGATIPPAYSFSFRFAANVKGTVHVAVVALDDAGKAIGSAAGDVDLTPSTSAHLPLQLTAIVAPPSGATLAFATQPTDALAKSALAPVRVAVLDGNGAPVSDTNVPVTLAIHDNPGGGTLLGTLTVNATAGVASFGDLHIDQAGSGYTLGASAPGAAGATSTAFNVKTTGWVPVNAGLSGGQINDVLLDPKHPATLYAATRDNGVWKSIDGGATWLRASIGLPARVSVDALGIDPVTTTTLYATLGTQGIYKTSDGGNAWQQSSSLAAGSGAPGAAVVVDPAHPMTVYAAGESRSILRTSNGGTSWSSIATNAVYGVRTSSIAVHPTTGEVWIAQFGDGLAKMSYGGNAFSAANGSGTTIIPGMHPYMKCVAFDPFDPKNMYASGDLSPSPTVFVSPDTGATWTPAATAPAHAPMKMAGFIGAGGAVRMYGAIPEEGIVSTPTARNRWDYNSAGITSANTLAVDPNTQNLVYAGNSLGVFRSSDSFNFTGRYDGLIGHGAYALVVDPKNGGKLYVGMRNGLFRSTDAGQSWSPPTSAMPGSTDIFALAVDFTDDKQLYLGTANWTFHSADFGANWSALNDGGGFVQPIQSLASSPSQSGTFYAGGTVGNAYAITSTLATWMPAGSGLPAANRIVALVVHPTNPMIVYAGTDASGVYETVNGGAVWAASNGGLGSMKIGGLAIDPLTPTTVYAATADGGVFKSSDGGASWSAASTGLLTMSIRAIALAPSRPGTLYVATAMGVYQSLDSAGSWAAYNAGLTATDVSAIVVDASDPLTAYAATWDGGVFKTVTR